jgi:hypothetical protein
VPSVTIRAGLAAALLAAAAPAPAQEAAPAPIEDPRAQKFADVERGVFAGMEVGALSFLDTPVADPEKYPGAGSGGGTSSGLVVGINAGVDLGSRLSVSAFALGTSQEASISYGAFDLLAAGLDLRWAFLARRDRNAWERFFAYVHARGGFAWSQPTGLFGDQDVLLGGGVGVEYYTQLRHFSVGLALDGLYAVSAGAPGISITPTVRYTF